MSEITRARTRLPCVAPGAVVLVLLAAQSCAGRREPVGRLTVEPSHVRLGYPHVARFALTWEPARSLDRLRGRPLVFLHLVTEHGRLVRVLDHELPEAWRAGVRQTYEIDLAQSALDEPLPAGAYLLTAGLYDSSWGYRWPVRHEPGTELGAREYVVATVEIEEARDPRPVFSFIGAWLPRHPGPRPGSGRRRLKAPGVVRVEGPASPGIVVLELSIASGSGEARVARRCGEAPDLSLAGQGRHRVETVMEDVGGGACTIDVVPAAGKESQTWLEGIAWYPSRGGVIGPGTEPVAHPVGVEPRVDLLF